MNANIAFPVSGPLIIGQFRGWTDDGTLSVEHGGETYSSRTLAELGASDVGCEVALLFSSCSNVPVVLGKLNAEPKPLVPTFLVELDGDPQPVDLTAQDQLTLRCGKASITLTKEGKIILRGTYISSRSSGPNRIKGGSVHLN